MNLPTTEAEKTDNFISLYHHVASICELLESYIQTTENPAVKANYTSIETLPAHPPLDRLCNKFNLTQFDRYILLLCVAMELEPGLGSLCAEINKNPGLSYPTPHIACKIFPKPSWSAFNPKSGLIKWELIEIKIAAVFTLSQIKINHSILFYLFGEPYSDRGLEDIVKPIDLPAENYLPDSHQEIADSLRQICWSKSSEKIAARPSNCAGWKQQKNERSPLVLLLLPAVISVEFL